uniref:Uncharacterized protein n=1 Tax=Ananas comosus var. bracteatus TaxID=296719 RepID=A0A6V7NP78_ANACO|nr:unnamed protein product [Ananas comosus var. bracteatus]
MRDDDEEAAGGQQRQQQQQQHSGVRGLGRLRRPADHAVLRVGGAGRAAARPLLSRTPAAAGHAFNLSAEPVCPTYRQHRRRCRPNDDHPRKQVRRSGVVEREYVQCGVKEQQQRKQQLQGRVVVAQNIVVAAGPSPRKPPRAPKAVDEDLYKIPPEFLYEKPRRKKLLRNLWSGCLGLNCVA